MKKSFLLLVLCVLCINHTHADPVTRSQAAQKAQAFLLSRGNQNIDVSLVYQGNHRHLSAGAPVKDPFYYVFNNGSGNGFVIVSGDNSTEEVLGYADHGTFDTEAIPENLQAWLDAYAEQITWARANEMKPIAKSGNGDTDVARQVIAPMVTAHWNQYAPYYNQCPLYGTGGTTGNNCLTGCVATAFAQVMYYHRWPKTATTKIPGYSPNSTIGDLGELPAVTFDWDNMNDVYTNLGNEPQAQLDAVATLFRYCGQAVEMDYTPSGSGASSSMIPSALTNYFGYQNQAIDIKRDTYGAEEWDELIYHEMCNARPVIYSAQTSGGSGHAFVCDGYDGHGMYHINWGWGGMSDGYYRLQALHPSTQGAGGSNGYGGYSFSQDAVIGISPKVVTDKAERKSSSGTETVSLYLMNGNGPTTTYSSESGLGYLRLSYSYKRVDATANYDIGLGLFKGDELIEAKYSNTVSTSGTTTGFGWIIQGFGKGLTDGTYSFKIVDRVAGTDTWYASNNSDNYYVNVEISGSEATLTTVATPPQTQLEVTGVEQRFEQGGSLKQLRAYLHNSGQKEYNGKLYLLVDGSLVGYEGLYLPAGGNDYVDIFFSASTGTHHVVLSTYSNGNSALYDENFSFSEQSGLPNLEVVSKDVRNVEGTNQYGRLMEIYLTLKNNTTTDYNGPITKSMRTQKPDNYFGVYDQDINVSIPAGATVTIPFTHDLAVGDKYWILIKNANQNFYEKYVITVQPAFVSWTADGQRTAQKVTSSIAVPASAVAASFEDIGDLTNTTITPNDNPNTLYYIAHTATAPTSLKGKNVVNEYEATAITLIEGKDFYVPQSFVASKISYSRTPSLGADGVNGWQTITLPFKVQEVTSDGKEVDWFHSSAEEEKDFWLREFTQVSGNVVKFADVATWMPNRPYIIAVPGDHWGKQYDMTGKEMKFSATNVQVIQTPVSEITSNAYSFIGTTCNTSVANAYILNAQGNSFELKGTASVKSTEGYFVSLLTDGSAPANLKIGFDDPTGIRPSATILTEGNVDVFNTYGMKVGTVSVHNGQADLSPLPRGIYIIQGTKIVK